MDGQLQLLMDKDEIGEVQARYSIGVDTKDFELFRSVFTDTIFVDLTEQDPDFIGNMPADDWVSQVGALVKGLKSTQHQMSNFEITVYGNLATAKVYFRSIQYLPNTLGDNTCSCGGSYENGFIRTEKGWKINSTKCHFLWDLGNKYLPTLAMAGV